MYIMNERVFIMLEYHQLNQSLTATRRSFQSGFEIAIGPDEKTIFDFLKQIGNMTDTLIRNGLPSSLLQKIHRHLLQLLRANRINLSTDWQLYPESSHPAHTESYRKRYTCFLTIFNAGIPYQLELNGNEKISVMRC